MGPPPIEFGVDTELPTGWEDSLGNAFTISEDVETSTDGAIPPLLLALLLMLLATLFVPLPGWWWCCDIIIE